MDNFKDISCRIVNIHGHIFDKPVSGLVGYVDIVFSLLRQQIKTTRLMHFGALY